jgi:hypothetical protein
MALYGHVGNGLFDEITDAVVTRVESNQYQATFEMPGPISIKELDTLALRYMGVDVTSVRGVTGHRNALGKVTVSFLVPPKRFGRQR